MSVNIKQNGDLTKVANNISIVQANWNDKDDTTKNTCIRNQPETLNTLEEISANTNGNALAGANAVKELNDSLGNLSDDVGTWEDVSIGTPSSGNLINGSIAKINRALKLGYFSIQVNGTSADTTIELGMTKTGNIFAPFYAYDHYTGKMINCWLVNNKITIFDASTVVRMFLLFPVD